MRDLIERQDAIDAIVKQSVVDKTVAKRVLAQLPSAEPEIIRCKDCKYYDGRPCGNVDYYNTESDFCSRAERRTDK